MYFYVPMLPLGLYALLCGLKPWSMHSGSDEMKAYAAFFRRSFSSRP